MQYSHLLIGIEEYREDPLYFDELAMQMPVLLIADRDQVLPRANSLHILYKPYNAMTLAEIFNGGDVLIHPRKYQETRSFIAPDARILVVDDNVMNLKVVEGLLRKYRIRIIGATSGEEALSLIESKDYDFVFMDHMMPGMDGIECFHRIRAKQGSHYFSKVPVIALTANAIAGSREMFLAEGFNDFVAKPIDNALLDQVLKKYIPESKQIYDEALIAEAAGKAEPAKAAVREGAQEMEEMEGIDMQTALAYCGGSIDDYIDLATVYCETGTRYYPQLVSCYENKDWKNYAILTHAIKSTSKTVGATRLSEIAYKEETAAKEGDEITITQYHQAMLDEYSRVLGLFRKNPRIGKQEAEPEKAPAGKVKTMTATTWKRVLVSLRKGLETYEADAVTEVMEKYRYYEYDNRPFTEIMRPVKEMTDAFDFEGAQAALEEIGGQIHA